MQAPQDTPLLQKAELPESGVSRSPSPAAPEGSWGPGQSGRSSGAAPGEGGMESEPSDSESHPTRVWRGRGRATGQSGWHVSHHDRNRHGP